MIKDNLVKNYRDIVPYEITAGQWPAVISYLNGNKWLAVYLPDLAGADWEEFSSTDFEPVVLRW